MRPSGWEARLTDVLREASTKPFDVRSWNCALFCRQCVLAVSGVEVPFRWHGSLEASVDAVLPRVEPRMALPGDVVAADMPERTLGVCLGRNAAFVSPRGVITMRMSNVLVAWSA